MAGGFRNSLDGEGVVQPLLPAVFLPPAKLHE